MGRPLRFAFSGRFWQSLDVLGRSDEVAFNHDLQDTGIIHGAPWRNGRT